MCTEWEVGAWRETLINEGLTTTTAPINVVFQPSSCHRNRSKTNHYSCNHTLVLAKKEATLETEVVRNLRGLGCGHMRFNTFPAASNIIGGYRPPQFRLRGSDGKPLRIEEKSKELLKEVLDRYTNPKARVLDFFAGSASLALACLELNRSYVGCEKKKDVHQKAEERLVTRVRALMQKQELSFPGTADHTPSVPITREKLDEYYAYLERAKAVDVVPEGVDPSASTEEQIRQDLALMDLGLEVRDVEGMGRGLFATTPMFAGTVVGYMWGTIYSNEGLRELCERRKVVRRTLTRRAELGECLPMHCMADELKPILNASDGCAMALINCARGPNNRGSVIGRNCRIIAAPGNSELRAEWRTMVNNDVAQAWSFPRLLPVVLTVDIGPGEQLLLDYGPEYWHGRDEDDEEEQLL
eukprot:3936422-Rhodomonas_salina.1